MDDIPTSLFVLTKPHLHSCKSNVNEHIDLSIAKHFLHENNFLRSIRSKQTFPFVIIPNNHQTTLVAALVDNRTETSEFAAVDTIDTVVGAVGEAGQMTVPSRN